MDGSPSPSERDAPAPYVIVVGNEKGGTGKSTTAMHLAVALMKAGFTVGTIDLDARQASLTAYIANRQSTAAGEDDAVTVSRHRAVESSEAADPIAALRESEARLTAALLEMADCQFVVIDTPGHDAALTRLGHFHADTLVTPINDSFLDLAVLAVLDCAKRQVLAPSHYTRMVWEQNNHRVVQGKPPIDWIVMRNRLTHIEARNKREIAALLELLGQRIGFRLAAGLGERVIYRELYHQGRTVFDLVEAEGGKDEVASHRAARREVRSLLEVIGLGEPQSG